MRKLGVMSIWGREDFVLPALEQALDLVDEVAVTVCCMHPALEKFRDRSRDLALGFARGEPRVHYLEMLPNYSLKWEVHMSEVLNALLDALRPESGDIVWLLDCDEFYNEAAQAEIAERIETNSQTPERSKVHSHLILCAYRSESTCDSRELSDVPLLAGLLKRDETDVLAG